MQRKFLLILCLLPTLASASLGDDVNSIIQKFWWGSDKTFDPKNSSEDQDIPTQKIDIPQTFSTDEIHDEIVSEENNLADFEEKISQKEHELWNKRTEKNSARTDLFLLDSEVSLLTDRLNKLVVQEEKWKKDLENLTRKKSELKATIRVEKNELDKYLARNFVRSENLGENENVSVLKWLFSNQTVAEILEENNRNRRFEEEKKKRISVLENLKKKSDLQEKTVAFLFSKIADLTQKSAESKQNLSEFSKAKANLISRLEFDEGKTLMELENYRREQAESTVVLQNLRQALDDTAEREYFASQNSTTTEVQVDNNSGKLDWPLKIPIKIVAEFHDENYKKQFDKVHEGLDVFASQSTEIYAPADGIVKKVSSNGYGYSYFILEHEKDFYTIYGHVSEILVNENDIVKRGDLIGKTGGTPGTTGAGYFTSGPHLHLEIFKNGKYVDPLKFLPEIQK